MDPFLNYMSGGGYQEPGMEGAPDEQAQMADIAAALGQPTQPNVDLDQVLADEQAARRMPNQGMAMTEAALQQAPLHPLEGETVMPEPGTERTMADPDGVIPPGMPSVPGLGVSNPEDAYAHDPSITASEEFRGETQEPERDYLAEPLMDPDELMLANSKMENDRLVNAQSAVDEERARLDADAREAERKHDEFQEISNSRMEANHLRSKEIRDKDISVRSVEEGRSTVAKIANAFAIVLGGGMAGGRGPNRGLEMVMGYIKQDVEDQRLQATEELKTLSEEKGIIMNEVEQETALHNELYSRRMAQYGMLDDMFKSEMNKYDPQGTIYLDHQNKRAAHQAMVSKEAKEMARFNEEQAFKEDKFKSDDKFRIKKLKSDERADKRSTWQRRRAADQSFSSAMAGHKNNATKINADIENDKFAQSVKNAELAVPGRFMENGEPYMAANAEAKKIVAKGDSSTQSLIKNLQALKKSHKEYGHEIRWSDEYQRRAALLMNSMNQYKEGMNLGAFDDGVKVLLEKGMGDAAGSFVADYGIRIDAVIGMIEEHNENVARVNALGGTGVMKTKEYPKPLTAEDLRRTSNPLGAVKKHMSGADDSTGAIFALQGLSDYASMGGSALENAATISPNEINRLVGLVKGGAAPLAQKMADDLMAKRREIIESKGRGTNAKTRESIRQARSFDGVGTMK